MAHDDFRHTDIHAGFNQVGAKGVPQIMEIELYSNLCLYLFQLVIGSRIGKLFSEIPFLLRNEDVAMVRMSAARADSAYAMLVAGATFEEAADYFSIPKQSLGSFEIIKGQAYKEFEDVAFTLNDG